MFTSAFSDKTSFVSVSRKREEGQGRFSLFLIISQKRIKYGEETYQMIKPVAETSSISQPSTAKPPQFLCVLKSAFYQPIKTTRSCHCRKHRVPIPPFLCDMLWSLLGILFVGMRLCQDTGKMRELCALKHVQNPHYLLLNSELTIYAEYLL